jgi:hypothetical protein
MATGSEVNTIHGQELGARDDVSIDYSRRVEYLEKVDAHMQSLFGISYSEIFQNYAVALDAGGGIDPIGELLDRACDRKTDTAIFAKAIGVLSGLRQMPSIQDPARFDFDKINSTLDFNYKKLATLAFAQDSDWVQAADGNIYTMLVDNSLLKLSIGIDQENGGFTFCVSKSESPVSPIILQSSDMDPLNRPNGDFTGIPFGVPIQAIDIDKALDKIDMRESNRQSSAQGMRI